MFIGFFGWLGCKRWMITRCRRVLLKVEEGVFVCSSFITLCWGHPPITSDCCVGCLLKIGGFFFSSIGIGLGWSLLLSPLLIFWRLDGCLGNLLSLDFWDGWQYCLPPRNFFILSFLMIIVHLILFSAKEDGPYKQESILTFQQTKDFLQYFVLKAHNSRSNLHLKWVIPHIIWHCWLFRTWTWQVAFQASLCWIPKEFPCDCQIAFLRILAKSWHVRLTLALNPSSLVKLTALDAHFAWSSKKFCCLGRYWRRCSAPSLELHCCVGRPIFAWNFVEISPEYLE